jgi:hypothetical protein
MALGLTQPLVLRNDYQKTVLWSRARPASKADTLTAIYEPTV